MRRVVLLAFVFALSLTACDTCTTLGQGASAYNKASCSGLGSDTLNSATCKNNISKCDSNDKSILNDFTQCLEQLPTCSSSTEAVFTADATSCLTYLDGLSPSCQPTELGLVIGQTN
jgi:hypothetical protein